VVNWQWDFGDGSPLSVPQATPGGAHTYSTAGTYTVTVTATGPVDTDSFSFPFTVIIPPPELTTPTFAVSPAVVNDILSFTVGSTSNSGTINSYSWSFSDGGVASGQSPTHTFTTTGPHSATVTATGPGGSDSATVSFTVYNPLSAQIGFTQIAGTLDVQFTGQSTGPPVVSWLWNFGDGTSSTVQNPLKTYSAAGTYSVTLTVTDAAGRTDTRPRSITVV
jgi:PKD repeat protein